MKEKRREDTRVYVTSGCRPSYDTAPTATADMTDDEQRTLRTIIARYMVKCRERAEKAKAAEGKQP